MPRLCCGSFSAIIPCSNGIVEGEVLVIGDPKTAKDYKDKILVAEMTDPGWVFILGLAKGIIAEKGSCKGTKLKTNIHSN